MESRLQPVRGNADFEIGRVARHLGTRTYPNLIEPQKFYRTTLFSGQIGKETVKPQAPF